MFAWLARLLCRQHQHHKPAVSASPHFDGKARQRLATRERFARAGIHILGDQITLYRRGPLVFVTRGTLDPAFHGRARRPVGQEKGDVTAVSTGRDAQVKPGRVRLVREEVAEYRIGPVVLMTVGTLDVDFYSVRPLAHEGEPIRSDGEGQCPLGSEPTGELREDRQIGVEPDPLDPSDAEREK